ncbi:LysR family transcriptional regulator [Pseudoruegeria sp. SK021]|uniref:LysR family transcriptional regulator n=1 Tax=Pseudoruegeria sp. SK021 TaxID=1933035 RepID=UPI000A23990D|nr:LysR family transcriptional regulator [Pseudoruegeria sp. SK021]OSP54657.1 hypothetical protein BV911_11715 [Pseudoruegeria sp. SK021]
MNKLTEMEAFTSVVDQGGFTGAARFLGVSKSAVSKHVSALEERLGVQLLTRTTRRVDPTDIGLLYYERARRVLNEAKEADLMATSATQKVEGDLRVAVMDGCAAQILFLHLTSFLDAHPHVSLILDQVDGYMEPRAAGIDVFMRSGASPDGDIRSVVLCDIELALVCAPDYLNHAPPLDRLEDLSSHALLLSLGAERAGLVVQAKSGELRRIYAPGRLVSRNVKLLSDAAVKGLGIALVPDFLIRDDLAEKRLVPVLPDLPRQSAPVYLGSPPESALSPRVRAFTEHMTACCATPI